MKQLLAVAIFALFGTQAFAENKPITPAPATQPAVEPGTQTMQTTEPIQMVPASRPIKQEKLIRKEIADFLKAEEELMNKRDLQGSMAHIDFPVWMATDNSTGVGSGAPLSRDDYLATMKPFYEQPQPKGMKLTFKHNVTPLTDSLASVVTDVTMLHGKKKTEYKSNALLIKKEGKWLYKMMAEGGWGDRMGAPGTK